MRNSPKVEIYVVLDDGSDQYYLLKVVRRGLDVYCFPPYSGVHYSLHESGEAHFKEENGDPEGKDHPVVLQDGEAGVLIEGGIIRASLGEMGRASGICTAMYPIESLKNDFQKFSRNPKSLFVIQANQLPKGTSWIEIGVWAVPERNKVSFEFNNPDILSSLLHKSPEVEPQIWIYARQFV